MSRQSRMRRLRAFRARKLPDLLASFWFLTSLVAALGVVLGFVVLWIDKRAGHAGVFGQLIISPDSARTILGSISGSLITIASLTSSLTIVTLQLLSNQYTPRTVRGFLATRLSQFVLGTFIGIFLYCLLLLVAVRNPGDANSPFVPSLGIVLAVLLAVVGLVVLVVFIHAMSQTIQVSTTTSRVSTETAAAVERVHGPPVEPAGPATTSGIAVPSGSTGYVRDVSLDTLVEQLTRIGDRICVHITVRPGDFVTQATRVAVVKPGREATPELTDAVRDAVVVQRERDLLVDPAFGVRQLVDIGLRALSPGINDPSTAITCLGYLRALVEDVAQRELPDTRCVTDGEVSVSAARLTFLDYLNPLVEFAAYAGSDARVVWTLLDALTSIANCCVDEPRRALVASVRDDIRRAAAGEVRLDLERRALDRDDSPHPG